MSIKLLDIVKLERNIPDRTLKEGIAGAIIFAHEKPNKAFEVEFSDDRGITVAQLALAPDEIELVDQ